MPSTNEKSIIIGELLKHASAKKNSIAVTIIGYYKLDADLQKNIAALSSNPVSATMLSVCAKFFDIPTHTPPPDNKKIYNKVELAKRIISSIESYLPSKCQNCSANYRSKYGVKPLLTCFHCGLGSHDCDQITQFHNLLQSISNPPRGYHWCCSSCSNELDINRKVIEKSPAINHGSPKVKVNQPANTYPITEKIPSKAEANLVLKLQPRPSSAYMNETFSNPTDKESDVRDKDVKSGDKNNDFVILDDIESDQYNDSLYEERNEETPNKAVDKPEQTHKADDAVDKHIEAAKDQSIHPMFDQADKQPVICPKFLEGICPHGLRGNKKDKDGNSCKYTHPKRCYAYCSYGENKRYGCRRGSTCFYYHPKICSDSKTYHECFEVGCSSTHLKGTRRYRTQNTSYGNSDHYNINPTNHPHRYNTRGSGRTQNTRRYSRDHNYNDNRRYNKTDNQNVPYNDKRKTTQENVETNNSPNPDISFFVKKVQEMALDLKRQELEITQLKEEASIPAKPNNIPQAPNNVTSPTLPDHKEMYFQTNQQNVQSYRPYLSPPQYPQLHPLNPSTYQPALNYNLNNHQLTRPSCY